jgi:hypothetical protein
MKSIMVAALLTLSSSAFAQTTAPATTQPAPAMTPTQAQCAAGWQTDMPHQR